MTEHKRSFCFSGSEPAIRLDPPVSQPRRALGDGGPVPLFFFAPDFTTPDFTTPDCKRPHRERIGKVLTSVAHAPPN